MMQRGRVWKFGDDISTDLMLPGAVLREPIPIQARHVFAANRPGWVDQVAAGDVLVGGSNFGMGSARPAPRSLKNLQLGFLVAEQVNSLFFRNCVNFGFLALDCPGVSALFEEGDIAELDVAAWSVRNLRTGAALQPLPVPDRFLQIVRAGGIFPMLQAEGLIGPPPSAAGAGTIPIKKSEQELS